MPKFFTILLISILSVSLLACTNTKLVQEVPETTKQEEITGEKEETVEEVDEKKTETEETKELDVEDQISAEKDDDTTKKIDLDKEINELDSLMNSVSDSDFDEKDLSDGSVGL